MASGARISHTEPTHTQTHTHTPHKPNPNENNSPLRSKLMQAPAVTDCNCTTWIECINRQQLGRGKIKFASRRQQMMKRIKIIYYSSRNCGPSQNQRQTKKGNLSNICSFSFGSHPLHKALCLGLVLHFGCTTVVNMRRFVPPDPWFFCRTGSIPVRCSNLQPVYTATRVANLKLFRRR